MPSARRDRYCHVVTIGDTASSETTRSPTRDETSTDALTAELAAARAQTDALRRLASALAGASTVDEVAAAVADTLAPTLGAAFSNVAVLTPDGCELRLFQPTAMNDSVAARWVSVPIDDSTPLGRAVSTGTAVHCADPDVLETQFPSGAADAARIGIQALAAFPLSEPGRETRAAIGLGWGSPTPPIRELVSRPVLALCGAALERAWTADDSSRLAALLDTLLQRAPVGFAFIDRGLRFSHVNQLLAETNGLSVADHLGRGIHDVVPDLAAQIEPVLRQIFETGEPQTGIEITGKTPAEPGRTRVWEEGFYPVHAPDDGVIGVGVVVVEVTEQRRERALLRRLAEREREIARRLQVGLLPTEVPQVPGYEISARYEAGTAGLRVGGDWYEVVEIRSDDIAIVVGDAVGHDLDAAIAMTQIRNALTGLGHSTDDPSIVIERLDGWANHNPSVLGSTLFYGRLEPTTGLLRYTLAGHHPPLVIHRDGSHDWFDAEPGPPIGVSSKRTTSECPLDRGDLLICYTDGLIEDRRQPIEAGRKRLFDTAGELGLTMSLEDFTESVLRRVPNPERPDDIVLLNLRRLR